ncbi:MULTISPECIES: DUF1345 domain-containing protein [Chryseobacterium]|jgi:uncharacterized membrane protein|uniref:DUF1345 domain-containing protein n=2 Tax=Chryseobacterium TaxID=59732 RepID=A0A101CHB2_9FLAO|nr:MULTISPECIES: DUF1345 domain-containing protein [Chryseobacterium]KUJ56247.1 hypothetical protein AR686_06645 [Chryseobacterium aquaticum subsp. greenlandense]QQV01832.1 DUF1345 domain-containing protein [Chryseobacterium sp. FDAARGOS 1104]VFB04951.1 Predicted membrane protein [Chryseobacterium taihuense]
MKAIYLINRLNNGVRLTIAAIVAIVVAILNTGSEKKGVEWMSIWLAFSVTHLFFSWFTIATCDVDSIKKLAKEQDSGRTTISLFILITTCVSLMGILLLYISAGEKSGSALFVHILMTIASIGTAWALVHTTFVFKYAHLYYKDKGLDFPGDDGDPDYMDFVYFSFVIGTTFQVSDVSITSKEMRRIALVHGLLSFIFNTVIVALTINILSSLLPK